MAKPNGLALLVTGKPSGEREPDEDESGNYDDALETAAEDLISAVEAKDVAGVASALRAAHAACAMED